MRHKDWWPGFAFRAERELRDHSLPFWAEPPASRRWRWRMSPDQHRVALREIVRSGGVVTLTVARRVFGYAVKIDRRKPAGTLKIERSTETELTDVTRR